MINEIAAQKSILIKQRRETIEILGFETRNKYEILTADGKSMGFAAEQQKGILGILLRQVFGHWRRFDINIFDTERKLHFVATHPFRFYFQRLEVKDELGKIMGHLERQFSILSKKFMVYNQNNEVSSSMYSGLFKIWTFPFKRNGKDIAKISKKWGGVGREVFFDADSFLLEFLDESLSPEEKVVLLNAAVFVDLMYFENNQGASFNIFSMFRD